ncbi:MAG TPA: hypothetical protein VHN78_02185 [Chloroflexota bacterium]|nr:hypothetical protein [Chloroflexota bacterium]HEX2184298.1 hypothetical protein [Chloroflexota bacterium]
MNASRDEPAPIPIVWDCHSAGYDAGPERSWHLRRDTGGPPVNGATAEEGR